MLDRPISERPQEPEDEKVQDDEAVPVDERSTHPPEAEQKQEAPSEILEQLQDHRIDEAVLKAAQAETARSGAGEKGDADQRQETNPVENTESPLSGESRVVESRAEQYKPLQAHQDV